MLGWAIGFFVAAIVAAVFGFGGIASAFTGIAIILFWVFVALFVLSLLFGAFRGGAHATGTTGGGSAVGLIALVAVVAIGVYAWTHNGMSAEKVGATIDRTASEVAENTSDALGEAGDRAQDVVQDTSREVQDGAAHDLRQAGDRVDPDNRDNN